MFKKILVPLDGSDNSLKILGWATGLARALEAEIHLLTVIDPEEIELLEIIVRGTEQRSESTAGGSAVGAAVKTPAEVIDETIESTRERLDTEAKKVSEAGVSVSTHVFSGSPAELIVHEATALGIDLIAMATRRESALARGILGSVTDRVLHSTSIPVLTMYPGELSDTSDHDGAPQFVVVPLDGSQLSESAVRPATEIARASGAELVFVESLRLPLLGVGVAGVEYGAGDYAGDIEIDAQKKEIEEYLKGFVDDAQMMGLKARYSLLTGGAAAQIVNEAASVEGSMVVMGSHGAGGLKRWVLGSVADKVIRSARRPVLVIPPQAG